MPRWFLCPGEYGSNYGTFRALELLQKSIVRVIRKGAPTQVIGATSFVPGKVDMVVAREQG